MKNIKIKGLGLLAGLLTLSGCENDFNTEPKNQLTLEQLLAEDPNAIVGLLS